MTGMKESSTLHMAIILLFVICLTALAGAGCMEHTGYRDMKNRTEAAVEIALKDPIVREQIPIATGEYEIVDAGPVQYEQTGPNGTFSGTFTAVTFRCCEQRSLYRVIVDDSNATIVSRYWQWVKEPFPCNGGEPPAEYSTIKEASAAVAPGCPLAVPLSIPATYSFSLVRVYGDPCPRRDIVYTRGSDELRLVHVCKGNPPYAFALSGNGAYDVTIGGARGQFVRGIGQNQVSWSDEQGSYWLLGDLQEEEILAVASSVKLFTPESGRDTEKAERHSLNVLRGESFSINGSVPYSRITRVQVWVLDGEITVHSVPVMPDGMFRFTFEKEETVAFPRDFSIAVVVHYPHSPDHFSIAWDESEGKAVTEWEEISPSILTYLQDNTLYPTTRAGYLEQAILKSGEGNSAETYFLNGVDGWIMIDPVGPASPGTLKIRGSTSLPEGTPLSVAVMTALFHPTPKNYDWSHEIADGSTRVVPGTGGINRFSCEIDTSDLYPGNYLIGVESRDDSLQADATGTTKLMGPVYGQQEEGNVINWSRLDLPPLLVNEEMKPEMLDGALRLVPPGTRACNNEIPYGSIIDCAPDGICRVFDQSGVQFLAVYYSNEARMMEVPDGAMIDTERVGNVTFVELDGHVILVKIDENTGTA